MVDAAEVGDNNRNRKRDHQHTTERADTTNDLPHDRIRYHVTIPEIYHTNISLHTNNLSGWGMIILGGPAYPQTWHDVDLE